MANIFRTNAPHTQPSLTPRALHREYPLTVKQMHFIEESRKQVRHILNEEGPRQLLIVGPCSIHDIRGALEFAKKLKELSDIVSDTFFVLMRVYYEKPRTGLGWKGLLYDPHLDGTHDINTGMRWTRKLLSDLTDLGVPVASEILATSSPHFFGDYITWGCIGARTASSQPHRLAASGYSMPIAFKNNTDGSIEIAVNGVRVAAEPHSYFGLSDAGSAMITHTEGNPDCHIVLRGGKSGPNYDCDSIAHAQGLLAEAGLPQRILVDCSHDNSARNHKNQMGVFEDVLDQIQEGNSAIRGMILESNLNEGNQELSGRLRYGVSITDPCLDWDTTAQMILESSRSKKLEVTRSLTTKS